MTDPRENCPWKCKHCLCYEGEIKRLSYSISELEAQKVDYRKGISSLSAENKRLEALDKNWLRASEQWVAEIERQKHINTTHLEEHQRLVGVILKAHEDLFNRYDDSPESSDECVTQTEKELFVIIDSVGNDLCDAYAALVSTEQAPVSPKTAIEKDGINDRGSDEYANPERDGDRQ